MAWHHEDLTVVSKAPLVGQMFDAIDAYTWGVDQTQHVVYHGADNHIHELWFHHGQGWNHADLTAVTGSPLSVNGVTGYTWDVDETQHVVYAGVDGHLHELWFHHGHGWNHNDLTGATGGPASEGRVKGYTRAADQTQHVAYHAKDGHTHQLSFSHSRGWVDRDLSAAAGNPPNANGIDLTGYAWAVDKTQHVFTTGGDFHIHELWFDGRWHHNDLTVASGGSDAFSAPAAYTWDVDSTQHVIYGSVDGHVHELWYDHTSGWNHEDLTAVTDCPRTTHGITGYTWDLDQSQRIVYLGKEFGIHELRFHHGRGWAHSHIEVASALPGPGVNPIVGYTWDVDQTQHVLYRGNDLHVHELWYHED
jgi:hypothetical protein